MQISLTKPELARFIEEQVRAGRYPTAEAVVEAALSDLRDNAAAGLDDAAIAAIHRAEEQIDRGEGIEFERFAAEMRKSIASR